MPFDQSKSDEILAKIRASVRKDQPSTNSEQHPPDPPPVASPPKSKAPPAMLNALAYARHGYRVFPCAPGDKVPRVPSWPRDATTDEAHIRSWWAQNALLNIGVPCGRGSFTALDVDGEEGKETLRQSELEHSELPETPMAITGGGGRHILFDYEPGIGNAVRFAPGLDIRNDGGYIVGVGSTTKAPYVWEVGYALGELPLAKMPRWLVERIKGGTNGDGKRVTKLGAYPPVPVAQAAQMLQRIDADNYNTWLQVGMALKAEYGVHGRPLWDSYSKRSAKYDPEGQDKKWASIDVEGGIGIGTVVKLAKEAGWVPAVADGNLPAYAVSFELHGGAIAANEEYLKREPVVAGLCYSSAVAMITGGKHAGKSTLARWLAICVAKGLPFLERQVQQGEVLYLASEDETMAARQELLRLGWMENDPIKFLSMSNVTVEQLEFLEGLKDYLRTNEVKLVIMDMLFDFAPIRDEMSYAQTREAVGAIQSVASVGNCHIVVVHHAPKYMVIVDAAVTALGSQGLAARVSPIIQVRRHGPGVHSVVSTSVRDPRGEAIEEKRLTLNEDGSLVLGKPWKDWMQAEVFAARVLDLFEGGEDGQEWTRADVQESLGISQPLAQACLKKLYNDGQLGRSGTGKRGKPFRYYIPIAGNADLNGIQGGGIYTNQEQKQEELGLEGIQVTSRIPSDADPDPERMKPRTYSNRRIGEQDDLDEYGISKSK